METLEVRRPARDTGYEGTLVLSKRGGELRVVDFGGFQTRHESVLRLIAAAESEHGLPDFPPLSVWTGDQPICTSDRWRTLSFSTAPGYTDVPVPDFLFDGWPQVGLGDYEAACASAAEVARAPAERPVLGWIGNCDTHPVRWDFHALARQHPDLLEAHHVSWAKPSESGKLATEAGNDMTLEEQVHRWAYLIDLEGRGWSARLKLLLHSGRPVFVQDRPWREWWWPRLEPMVHFVPVRRDLSDLLDRVRWAQENAADAERIGMAGQRFARDNLTRADAVREWAGVFRRLAGEPYLPYARRRRLLLGRVLHRLPAARP